MDSQNVRIGMLNTIAEVEDCERVEKSSGPVSRTSINIVLTVLGSFDKQKRDIVQSLGWGGVLNLPELTKLNLKFAVWILSKVDENRRSIVISEKKVYKFDGSDVEKVFGVPSSGRNIRDKTLDKREFVYRTIRTHLGITSKDVRSCKPAQSILDEFPSSTRTST